MAATMASTSTSSHSSSALRPNTLFLSPKSFPNREFRRWKRRRLKSNPNLKPLTLKNDLESSTPPFDFLSLLPSNWIPPAALGFASALALSLSTRNPNPRVSNPNPKPKPVDIGEWILFSTPTPFNRFVFLRCPSIQFEGVEFLEDVNEKLVREDKHYVRLDSGRIEVRDREEIERESESELAYQRVCVRVKDGGVVSLDWPANLDLNEEVGLDTTVLLVPGTTQGSMDVNVRGFVCECLKRGLFPIVMNPRGCAGSPLTTAR